MATITKKELVNRIAERLRKSKDGGENVEDEAMETGG